MQKRQPVLIIMEERTLTRTRIAKNKTAASKILGISRTKLSKRIDSGEPIDRSSKITVDLAMQM